jgi:hypothetical protein
MARAADTLYKITAYERAKMKSKDAPPDQHEYGRVPPDLTKLTRAELDALEKMVLKVGGGSTAGVRPGTAPAIGGGFCLRPIEPMTLEACVTTRRAWCARNAGP